MDTVALSFEVRWSSSEPAAEGFAVFVDRDPVPPGHDLRWLADREDDAVCLARPECPDEQWLRARRIMVVHGNSATIEVVEDRVGDRSGGVHRVAVVPLDGAGRRMTDRGDSLEIVVEP